MVRFKRRWLLVQVECEKSTTTTITRKDLIRTIRENMLQNFGQAATPLAAETQGTKCGGVQRSILFVVLWFSLSQFSHCISFLPFFLYSLTNNTQFDFGTPAHNWHWYAPAGKDHRKYAPPWHWPIRSNDKELLCTFARFMDLPGLCKGPLLVICNSDTRIELSWHRTNNNSSNRKMLLNYVCN